MERVGVLIDKLQKQFQQNAEVQNLLVTVQLLHNELLLQANQANDKDIESKNISVVVPNAIAAPVEFIQNDETGNASYKPVPKPETEPVPVAEPIPEPEAPMPETEPSPTPKPEPEPIPHFVEQNPWLTVFPPKEEKKTSWSLDPVFEVPTLAHQENAVYELNQTMINEGTLASINDKLKQNKSEMASVLQDTPIKDLKKAISINDRHRFIHELFRDDENMYERSIKTINGFHILAEAEFWIQRELKLKLGWDTNLELVKTFDHLVKRRFL
ncbi:hypothetical protein [Segetibacter koreensis]|uniref:hypothetical protein n=1 Tax=Segetibacter koreensis TaxID=398037 RepID=UPI000366C2BB|nr:hypothetical protein [Segetibacter koreensis]